jgi:hypothetical protein
MKKKQLNTLIEDIYSQVEILGRGEALNVTDDQIEDFGNYMKEALRDWLTPKANSKPTLRMSNIGKPSRQLWFDMNSEREVKGINAPTMIKFLYGHILERVVLFLTELGGHEVTDEQKEIKVNGILGHMDCKIDGEVIDIKSASNYAFQKFKNGTLAEDDPFGYMAQLAGYESAEGTDNGGFLAINKETGELALFQPQELDKPNIDSRIKQIKSQVKNKTLPDFCYEPVSEGTSGNFKIARGCTWCPHKFECHKDSNDGQGLRVFQYSKGMSYLTKVVREPKVEEITHRFINA